jgi:predicted acylesterase/phospholipase RssA
MNDLVSEPAPALQPAEDRPGARRRRRTRLAHIGVLDVLTEAGYAPEVIAGTSIGAVVGGCYAAGKLEQLREFALGLTKRRVVGLMDFHLGGAGLIAGSRLKRLLEREPGRPAHRRAAADLRRRRDRTRYGARNLADPRLARRRATRLLRAAGRVRSREARRSLADGRGAGQSSAR